MVRIGTRLILACTAVVIVLAFAGCMAVEQQAVQQAAQRQVPDEPLEPIVAPPPPVETPQPGRPASDNGSINPLQDELDEKLSKLYGNQ